MIVFPVVSAGTGNREDPEWIVRSAYRLKSVAAGKTRCGFMDFVRSLLKRNWIVLWTAVVAYRTEIDIGY